MTQYLKFLPLCFGLCVALSSCGSSGSSVYHWSPVANIGPQQFVQDHNYCVRKADSWPFDDSPSNMMDWVSPGPHDPKHRLSPDEDRVWASFVPYPGAQVIYVNDVNGSGFVDGDEYASCMEAVGYVQALPPEDRVNLILDRRMGYRGEY